MRHWIGLAFAALSLLGTNVVGQENENPDLDADWSVPDTIAERTSISPPWHFRDLKVEGGWAVTDMVAEDRCSAPLRKFLFTEIYRRDTSIQRSETMKYLWCKVDAGSEREAQAKQLDMNLIYEALRIDVTQRDAFQKAREWRNINCGEAEQRRYLAASASEFSQVINVPVALEALRVYEVCVRSSSHGLNCKAFRQGETAVGFFINYNSPVTDPDGRTRAPKIVRSRVDNAKRPGSTDHTVFKTGRIIPGGGLSTTVVQDDLTRSVIFDVEITRGFPSCNAKDLVVEPGPSYVVTANIDLVEGSRKLTRTFSGERWFPHVNCHQSNPIPVSVSVCPNDGFVLDKNRFVWDAAQNPKNPQGRTKHICFGAISGSIAGDGASGCVNTVVTILECNQTEAGPACEWAWQHGSNGGSRALASIEGNKVEVSRVGPFVHTWSRVEGGSRLALPAPGLATEFGALSARWSVSITNTIANSTVVLSQPGKVVDRGHSAYFLPESRELVIHLAK